MEHNIDDGRSSPRLVKHFLKFRNTRADMSCATSQLIADLKKMVLLM
jgi:hypothetical protein